MNINKLDMPLYQVDEFVNNSLYKDDSILLVFISAQLLKIKFTLYLFPKY